MLEEKQPPENTSFVIGILHISVQKEGVAQESYGELTKHRVWEAFVEVGVVHAVKAYNIYTPI